MAVGTFQIAGPFAITPAEAGLDHGNGNGVLQFSLNAVEQAQLNALVAQFGSGLEVGAFGDWGCPPGSPPGCMPSNGGQESLIAFAVPGPTVGAGLPGPAFAALGMIWFNRQRKQRMAF
jgi:hypothetical protein